MNTLSIDGAVVSENFGYSIKALRLAFGRPAQLRVPLPNDVNHLRQRRQKNRRIGQHEKKTIIAINLYMARSQRTLSAAATYDTTNDAGRDFDTRTKYAPTGNVSRILKAYLII
jgi:hypothetical protein